MNDDTGWPPVMACKKCGLALNEDANICPVCGTPVNRMKLPLILLGSFLGFFVLIYVLYVYMTQQAFKDYEALLRTVA
jgi:predicted amidophosphoribosyltransferase